MSDHKHAEPTHEAEAPTESKNNGGGKKPIDPELKAMGVVDGQLSALSEEQRRRVILWVVMKHRLAGCFLGGCIVDRDPVPGQEPGNVAA